MRRPNRRARMLDNRTLRVLLWRRFHVVASKSRISQRDGVEKVPGYRGFLSVDLEPGELSGALAGSYHSPAKTVWL
jgi:hypothetical protein